MKYIYIYIAVKPTCYLFLAGHRKPHHVFYPCNLPSISIFSTFITGLEVYVLYL